MSQLKSKRKAEIREIQKCEQKISHPTATSIAARCCCCVSLVVAAAVSGLPSLFATLFYCLPKAMRPQQHQQQQHHPATPAIEGFFFFVMFPSKWNKWVATILTANGQPFDNWRQQQRDTAATSIKPTGRKLPSRIARCGCKLSPPVAFVLSLISFQFDCKLKSIVHPFYPWNLNWWCIDWA